MKRQINIILDDANILLNLSKVTSVKTDKQMIHLDKLDNGTWRLIYNENLIPDFSKVLSLDIIRG